MKKFTAGEHPERQSTTNLQKTRQIHRNTKKSINIRDGSFEEVIPCWYVQRPVFNHIWATDEITCLGKMPSSNVGGPLSVIRCLDVQDINIKAETSNLQCGMIWFATWSIITGEHAKMRGLLLTANENNDKIFERALIGTYENINPAGETMKLERKEG